MFSFTEINVAILRAYAWVGVHVQVYTTFIRCVCVHECMCAAVRQCGGAAQCGYGATAVLLCLTKPCNLWSEALYHFGKIAVFGIIVPGQITFAFHV